MTRCPRCFRSLLGDMYAFECAYDCQALPDPAASAASGTAVYTRPLAKVQRPPDARRWVPPTSLDCPSCGRPGREVCPYCHYALLPGWREWQTVCIALAGARATGKSVYLAVLIKQLEQALSEAGLSMSYATEKSRRTYEENYEKPLYEVRGIMAPTVAANVADAYQRDAILLDLGILRGGKTMLVLRDVAGEDLENPAEDQSYLSYFERADAVLFMFDPSAVGEVRELLKDYLPPQLTQVGDPERVLEMVLRLVGQAPVPIGMILSKFDTMQALSDVQDAQWRRIMANPGAAFSRDPGIRQLGYDRNDGDLLHEEVRSLLHLLNAKKFVNALAPRQGTPRDFRFFTVSALGEATHGEKLHPRGIAPFRCLDPLRWVLDRNGIV